jgi:hypothetical protein
MKRTLETVSSGLSKFVEHNILNMDAFLDRSELVYNTYNGTMLSINRDVMARLSQLEEINFNPGIAFNTMVHSIPDTKPIIRDLTSTYSAMQSRNMVISIWRSVWVLIKQAVNRININVSKGDMVEMLLQLCGSLSPTLNSFFRKYSSKDAVSIKMLNLLEGQIDPYVDDIIRTSYRVVENNLQRFGLYIGDLCLSKPVVNKNPNMSYKSFGVLKAEDVPVDTPVWSRIKIYKDGAFNEWSEDYSNYDFIILEHYPCNYDWDVISDLRVPTNELDLPMNAMGVKRWPMPESIMADGFPTILVEEFHSDISEHNIMFNHKESYDNRFHIYPLDVHEMFDEGASLLDILHYIDYVDNIVLEEYKFVDLSNVYPLVYIGG